MESSVVWAESMTDASYLSTDIVLLVGNEKYVGLTFQNYRCWSLQLKQEFIWTACPIYISMLWFHQDNISYAESNQIRIVWVFQEVLVKFSTSFPKVLHMNFMILQCYEFWRAQCKREHVFREVTVSQERMRKCMPISISVAFYARVNSPINSDKFYLNTDREKNYISFFLILFINIFLKRFLKELKAL